MTNPHPHRAGGYVMDDLKQPPRIWIKLGGFWDGTINPAHGTTGLTEYVLATEAAAALTALSAERDRLVPDAVEALVAEAVAQERERCAKVAEDYWSGIPESEVGEAVCDAVFAVAAAIRAGGGQ